MGPRGRPEQKMWRASPGTGPGAMDMSISNPCVSLFSLWTLPCYRFYMGLPLQSTNGPPYYSTSRRTAYHKVLIASRQPVRASEAKELVRLTQYQLARFSYLSIPDWTNLLHINGGAGYSGNAGAGLFPCRARTTPTRAGLT